MDDPPGCVLLIKPHRKEKHPVKTGIKSSDMIDGAAIYRHPAEGLVPDCPAFCFHRGKIIIADLRGKIPLRLLNADKGRGNPCMDHGPAMRRRKSYDRPDMRIGQLE